MSDAEAGDFEKRSYTDELNARRLDKRIAVITHRVPKPVHVPRADGTMLLQRRRRADRLEHAADRRAGERRTQA